MVSGDVAYPPQSTIGRGHRFSQTMLNGLNEAIEAVEQQRKTLEVYSSSADKANEISAQFSTKNVSVTHSPLPADAGEDFVIIRGPDGGFLGSLGVETFDAILSPDVHPPWVLAESDAEHDEIFDFLDNTLFSSYNRQQMLVTAREIEERAWRIGAGRLYTGFQDVEALRAQEGVYERLASQTQLSIRLYVNAEWDIAEHDQLPVHAEPADEIGAFWFVIYDGGGDDADKCGLIAEERQPGEYYGFWTYDPAIIDDVISYLEARYGSP